MIATEWGVVTHPAGFQGGKSLRARIRRPGVPESETEMIWPAHVKVQVRRANESMSVYMPSTHYAQSERPDMRRRDSIIFLAGFSPSAEP